MKTTISKRFDALNTGDIVMKESVRLAVAHVSKRGAVQCVSLSGPLVFTLDLPRPADGMVQVEVEQQPVPLTPAQQHADELVEMLWRCANMMRGSSVRLDVETEARALLDKIDPPQPPTLDEALGMLRDIREVINPPGLGVTTGQMLDAMLDRARRSGVLS